MSGAFLLAVAGVFVIGMAIQRGNTCTLVAFDDLVARRSPHRALAIASTWLWVAGGLAMALAVGGIAPTFQAVAVGWTTIAGGLLLGLGALVNGACAIGTIARIGSGQWAYLATLPGFLAGSVAGPIVFGDAARTHATITPSLTTLDAVPLALLLGVAILVVSLLRILRAADRDPRRLLRAAWSPGLATALIGLLFVGLVQTYGPWAYTDLLAGVALGRTPDPAPGLGLLVAMVCGAVVAGAGIRGSRPVGYLPANAARCLAGGFVMALGNELVPGAYDGLTLLGQPLLLPHAWVAMTTCYLVILGAIAARHRRRTRLATVTGGPT